MSSVLGTGDARIEEFTVGSSSYLMAPEAGFRLLKWTLTTARDKREILHWPSSVEETPIAKIRGGNPILFPFSARSYDRGVIGAWRTPSGERREMPMHGFARDSQFIVESRSDDQITGRLVPSESASAAYPYDYTMRASYKFEELALTVVFSLENHGPEPIPWSAGHHFYFTLPWHPGARRADYQLKMDARKCAYHGPDGKLVMSRDRDTCHDLSNTELLDRIHWQLRHNRVSFGPKGGEEDIHIVIGNEEIPQKGYTVVTWSESETAPYYCVEPWMGPPNAAEHGKGLHWVNSGDSQSFKVEVSLY